MEFFELNYFQPNLFLVEHDDSVNDKVRDVYVGFQRLFLLGLAFLAGVLPTEPLIPWWFSALTYIL